MIGAKSRTRGGALGLVLAVAALALLAAFVAANVATLNLRMASQVSNGAVAEGLAESVVQEAMANLQEDLGFQDSLEMGPGLGLPEGARGYLTFDETSGGPYSTNNFLGEDNSGWGRTVPDQSIHLVGVGECGGVTRYVEAVVHLPEFPVAVACKGPIEVTDSVVAAFNPEDERPWIPGSGYALDDDELEPGHLVSNATGARAVVLDSDTKISGDIQSRGQVDLNGAIVEGEVRAPWDRNAPLPEFDLNEFDPKNNEDMFFEELESIPSSLSLVGNVRYEGDMLLIGDLELDNSFLFVRGNLEVGGDLRGVGSIVATGKATFKGTTSLSSSDQLALLTSGGIELVGRSPDRSVFNGLIYTQGPFHAEKVTIFGAFIADHESTAVLKDSNVFFSRVVSSPEMNLAASAVVPRFYAPSQAEYQSDLGTHEFFKIPIGRWEKGKEGYFWPASRKAPRTVANVLDITHPNWSRSNWDQYDPAVITRHVENGQIFYTYAFWGRNSGDATYRDNAQPHFPPPMTAEDVVTSLLSQGTSSNSGNHLDDQGAVTPNPVAYRNYLEKVIEHLDQSTTESGEANFTIDPNEFIVSADELRVIYYRKFSP